MTDLATDLTLQAIDRIGDLRRRMQDALDALSDGRPDDAMIALSEALNETDPGEMKVWQPGEVPF